MSESSVNGKPIYTSLPGMVVPNSFEMHAGACNWGRGRFLMRQDDYDTLWPNGGGTGVLALTDDTTQGALGPAQALEIPVVAAGYRHVQASTQNAAGVVDTSYLVEAVFYDNRSSYLSTMIPGSKTGYNVVDPSDGTTYPSTQNTGVDWTWADIATDLGFDFAEAVTWPAKNLVFDGYTTLRAIDAIASTIKEVVGFDWTTGAMTMYAPATMSAGNSTLYAKAAGYIIGGGTSERNPGRKPATVRYMFRIVQTDGQPADPMDPALRWHSIDTATGIAGASGTMPLILPNVAVKTSGSITNTSDLAAAASDIHARIVAGYNATLQETVYAGLWPFTIDGAIQGIRWISDAAGARTVVRFNFPDEFLPWDAGHLAYELMQPTRVSGTGDIGTTAGPAGAIAWSVGGEEGTAVTPYYLDCAGSVTNPPTSPAIGGSHPCARTWNRATPPGGTDGVEMWVCTGYTQDALGHAVPPFYYRLAKYDSAGALVSISGEVADT